MVADAQPVSDSAPETRRGRLVVLAGPSAVGKSTVVRVLRTLVPDLLFSVSATTRDPRPGEVEGHDYYFVTRDTFDRMIEGGDLLEWADIHGGLQRSGTPGGSRRGSARVRSAGARRGRPRRSPRCPRRDARGHTRVLAPPSWEVLVERLTGRGTESEDVVARRLETARTELAAKDEFDIVIVNDDVDRACAELVSLLVGPHAT